MFIGYSICRFTLSDYFVIFEDDDLQHTLSLISVSICISLLLRGYYQIWYLEPRNSQSPYSSYFLSLSLNTLIFSQLYLTHHFSFFLFLSLSEIQVVLSLLAYIHSR